MKLWSSFVKELTIASRGFYFYVEIAMAAILLFVLLFVIPNNFDNKETQYLYLEFPNAQSQQMYIESFNDLDGKGKTPEDPFKIDKEEINSTLYVTEDKEIYVFDTEEDMAKVAEKKHKLGVSIKMNEANELNYTYYTQGNETEKFSNILKIIHGPDDALLYKELEGQPVKTISTDYVVLSDRENVLPVFLTFNGSLMGLFIMAAYVFLDKKEGVIKAYAITPSPVWKYLLSKVLILTVTALTTSLILILPIMGTRINYLLLIVFLIPTGFFASALGLLIASYFDDMVKSFGVMYLLMIAMMMPTLSYFIASWDPMWLKFIPSYYIVYGFKEIFTKGDTGFILLIALGYLVVSSILFAWANARYKKTLSV
ncbi:MAG: ABC transporter permease [Clostridiales bacterium]|nr:ABC transporter permease [Clostridiales bacterium]